MKLSKLQTELKTLSHTALVHLINGEQSITMLCRKAQTESDVLFCVSSMLADIKPTLESMELSHYQARMELKVKNHFTKYIQRCRSGDDKTPAIWFDKAKTLSFDPVSFVEVKTRQVKKKTESADDKAIQEKAQILADTMLADKVTLTKAQTAKLEKAQAQAQTEKEKAQTLAKQAQAQTEKEKAQTVKLSNALKSLQEKHNQLVIAHEKALRTISALEKALKMVKMDDQAIQAIMRSASA